MEPEAHTRLSHAGSEGASPVPTRPTQLSFLAAPTLPLREPPRVPTHRASAVLYPELARQLPTSGLAQASAPPAQTRHRGPLCTSSHGNPGLLGILPPWKPAFLTGPLCPWTGSPLAIWRQTPPIWGCHSDCSVSSPELHPAEADMGQAFPKCSRLPWELGEEVKGLLALLRLLEPVTGHKHGSFEEQTFILSQF